MLIRTNKMTTDEHVTIDVYSDECKIGIVSSGSDCIETPCRDIYVNIRAEDGAIERRYVVPVVFKLELPPSERMEVEF